jgi:hypothetical protein
MDFRGLRKSESTVYEVNTRPASKRSNVATAGDLLLAWSSGAGASPLQAAVSVSASAFASRDLVRVAYAKLGLCAT